MAERVVKSAKVRKCVACERTEAGEVPLEWRKLADGTMELCCVDPVTCRLTWTK